MIAYDPNVMIERHYYWAPVSANLASGSLPLLLLNLGIIRYAINQLEDVWSLTTMSMLFLGAAALAMCAYTSLWWCADLVVSRAWTLGDKPFSSI